MNRRQFLAISSATLAAVPLRTLLDAQAPQPAPQPRFENIRRNVGYFTARGGTIGWLSNKDSLVTVDTQYLDTAKLCLDGLRERAGGRGIDVAFNTHHHGDHTSGNPIFKSAAKRLIAQARVPELQKQFASEGSEVVRMSSAEFGAFMVREMNKWGRVVSAGGIKGE